MRPTDEFTPLRIVKKNLTDSNRCTYRVFKNPDEYITVEAATALEAFRESGIANPYRILRETRFMERLVDQSKFSEREELIETGAPLKESSDGFTQQTAMQPAKLPLSSEIQGRNPTQSAEAQPEDNEMEKPLEKTPPVEEILSPDDVSKLLEG